LILKPLDGGQQDIGQLGFTIDEIETKKKKFKSVDEVNPTKTKKSPLEIFQEITGGKFQKLSVI
jgi:hypothetical protein